MNSPQSISMRKSCLNHFFRYFGVNKSVFKLTKADIKKYFVELKNNQEYSLNTKKNKFRIFRSFILDITYLYEEKFDKIPQFERKYNWGDQGHADKKEKEIILLPDDIEKILAHFKKQHFVKYLIFSLYAFTGCRKGELQNLRIKGVDLKNRTITTSGKKGKKVYCFDDRLTPELEMFLEERNNIEAETDHFFLTINHKPIALRTFNLWLKPALKSLNLPNKVSIQYFRWSINNNRKDITKTTNDECEVLMGHAPSNVNSTYYTRAIKPQERITLYDNNNPYKAIII